jgi:hypothetical protein
MIILFLIANTIYGQTKPVKLESFSFSSKSKYEIKSQEEKKVILGYEKLANNIPISFTLEIKKAFIDPVKNGINEISDISKLSRVSTADFIVTEDVNEGVQEIGTKEIFFRSITTEYYADFEKSKLIGYRFENVNFLLASGNIYLFTLTCELNVNELIDPFEQSDYEILDLKTITDLMDENIDLEDVRIVINSFDVKE